MASSENIGFAATGDLEMVRCDLEALLRREFRDTNLRVEKIDPIPEGHSGFTYWVDVGGTEYVLRLPPVGARPVDASDVARQGRIMAAVHAAGIPTPVVVSVSGQPIIDGRPYLLMERVAADRIEVAGRISSLNDLALAAVDVLRRLHALPLTQTGIQNEEPIPIRHEMVRWALLMQRGASDLTKRAAELGGLIAERIPDEAAPGLVHGDYTFGNLLFKHGEVAAVLDWEIASIGQTALDIGSIARMVVLERLGQEIVPGRSLKLDLDRVLQTYGLDRVRAAWFIAFTLYKYAAIVSFNVMLDRRGRRPDPYYARESTQATVPGMIDEGVAVIQGRSHLI